MNIQDFMEKIDAENSSGYPCDEMPGIFYAENGEIERIVTAASQLRILGEKSNEIWAPSLYQSSMHPEKKVIRTLTIEQKEGTLYLYTRYGKRSVDMERESIEVSEWIPKIHKIECTHCENCGRCGW